MALILDTGPIVALLDAGDPEHARCVAMVDELREDLVVPSPVLVEVDYWLRKLYGAGPWDTFVEDIATGAYRLHHLDEHGLVRAAEIEQSYESLDLGLVDAAVMVTCETLGETKVATLDRRDFAVVRPRHCESLTLLPVLEEELRSPGVYYSLLEELPSGRKSLADLAAALGRRPPDLQGYLRTLRGMQVVDRHAPVAAREDERNHRWELNDGFMRFWFRFVFPYQEDLKTGLAPGISYREEIEPQLAEHVSPTFEALCGQWVLRTAE